MASIKVDDISSKIAKNVGSAVEATNKLPGTSRNVEFRYNRKNPKRRRFLEASSEKFTIGFSLDSSCGPNSAGTSYPADTDAHEERGKPISGETIMSIDIDERLASLSSMVAVLCEQQLFLPLLRAFEMFLPSCSLLSFIRALQVRSNSLFSLKWFSTNSLFSSKWYSTNLSVSVLPSKGIFSNASARGFCTFGIIFSENKR